MLRMERPGRIEQANAVSKSVPNPVFPLTLDVATQTVPEAAVAPNRDLGLLGRGTQLGSRIVAKIAPEKGTLETT